MSNVWMDRIMAVSDEKSFLHFVNLLREDHDQHARTCHLPYVDCAQENHWETRSIGDFLKSAADWGSGDFADGAHGDDPILRRVATMLYTARYYRADDRPERSSRWEER